MIMLLTVILVESVLGTQFTLIVHHTVLHLIKIRRIRDVTFLNEKIGHVDHQ